LRGPVRDLGDVKREPAGQQQKSPPASPARPRQGGRRPYSASSKRVNTVAAGLPRRAPGSHRRARAPCACGVRPDRRRSSSAARKYAFHAGRNCSGAPPSNSGQPAVLALDAAQIGGNPALPAQDRASRPSQCTNSTYFPAGIRSRSASNSKHEMPVGPLLIEQGRRSPARSPAATSRAPAQFVTEPGFRLGSGEPKIFSTLDFEVRRQAPRPGPGADARIRVDRTRQTHQLDPDLADRVVRHQKHSVAQQGQQQPETCPAGRGCGAEQIRACSIRSSRSE